MVQPLLHLICGSTGAGKTTYAAKLVKQLNGVSLSIDEWMSALFWMDAPDPLEASWSLERVDRCARMILKTAVAIARTGTPCVLEIGLTTRRARSAAIESIHTSGILYQLHFVDLNKDERWRRVQARNADVTDTAQLGFAVTREMFDFVEAMWEKPSEEELASHCGVRVTS